MEKLQNACPDSGLDLVARLGAVSRRWRRGTLRGRRGTWRHRPSFCMAGVALMTLGWICWRAWAPLVARGTAALCVAGVSLGDIYRRVAWQAWRLATSTFVLRDRPGTWRQSSTFVLRGRRGTWRHLPSFCVAGVALGDIHHCFAWQAWRLATSTFVLRGRRGTW